MSPDFLNFLTPFCPLSSEDLLSCSVCKVHLKDLWHSLLTKERSLLMLTFHFVITNIRLTAGITPMTIAGDHEAK